MNWNDYLDELSPNAQSEKHRGSLIKAADIVMFIHLLSYANFGTIS